MNLKKLELRRLTVHKVYGKTKSSEPYAAECLDFCKLGSEGDKILFDRIEASLDHKSKFFELDLENKSADSFFNTQKPLWGSPKQTFLKISQSIADIAAESHSKINIPDGLLIIIEALIDGHNTIITIKAEKSDAFSMKGNDLQLIKDIFLSSDKALYKLGFFVKHDKNNSTPKSYKYYVYDDAFAPAKEDLAFYFYSKFLGLSTEKNSKLQTNNFYKKLTKFATTNLDLLDTMPILRNIDNAFRDEDRKSLSSPDFRSFFPNELAALYKSEIENEFPFSIVKNNAIVGGLKSKRISISQNTTLLLKNHPEGILIGNTANKLDKSKLKTVLDSGKNYNYVVIPASLSDDSPIVES